MTHLLPGVGSEDDMNEKLRREMRRWLAASAEAVITRTDPYRPALDATAMALGEHVYLILKFPCLFWGFVVTT